MYYNCDREKYKPCLILVTFRKRSVIRYWDYKFQLECEIFSSLFCLKNSTVSSLYMQHSMLSLQSKIEKQVHYFYKNNFIRIVSLRFLCLSLNLYCIIKKFSVYSKNMNRYYISYPYLLY